MNISAFYVWGICTWIVHTQTRAHTHTHTCAHGHKLSENVCSACVCVHVCMIVAYGPDVPFGGGEFEGGGGGGGII